MIVTMQKKADAEAANDLFLSGLKLHQDGAFDAAAREFGAAAELAPTKAKYLYFQALATYQKGDFNSAGELVKSAVRVEQENPGESWGRMMERIQGPHRLWLEDARRQNRDAAPVSTADAR
jgi:tetratricopeptide (TPR) repeat protein